MYCVNYESFDYGPVSSGRLSEKLRPSTQRAAWYANNLFFPRGILTDVRTVTLLP